VQSQLREAGLPIPGIFEATSGEAYAVAAGQFFVLSEFMAGRRYSGSTISSKGSLALGRAHASLLDALAGYSTDAGQQLPDLATIEARLQALLALGSPLRGKSVRAEHAYLTIEQRLRMLHAWRGDPPLSTPQLTHGDFTGRNVLFEDEEVTAILDFDNLRLSDRARDVMRCFTLSFSEGSGRSFGLFQGVCDCQWYRRGRRSPLRPHLSLRVSSWRMAR
jgi:Ser/Thr protein kinase RdoA (MazF antagonist)